MGRACECWLGSASAAAACTFHDPQEGKSALHLAAERRHTHVVRALLEMEAAVTPQLKVRILEKGRALQGHISHSVSDLACACGRSVQSSQADARLWAVVEPLAEEVELGRLMASLHAVAGRRDD